MKERMEKEKEILQDIKLLRGFEISLKLMRDAQESGRFDNEELYPLDTFKYNPECISELLRETRDTVSILIDKFR